MIRKRKVSAGAMVSAVVAGGAYEMTIQGLAKKADFINDNYLLVKSMGAGIVGSGLVYFGKDENAKAAGYGLLGVSGAAGASKLSTLVVTDETQTDGEPLNGVVRQKLRNRLTRGNIHRERARQSLKRGGIAISDQRRAMPERTPAPMANDFWSKMLYADPIYLF